MSKLFFTSDLHFGHSRILEICKDFRPFSGIEEMDEYLINLWNENVSSDDIVYDLGDFTFYKDLKDIKRILRRLNGHHILILGNHDHIIRQNKELLLKEKKSDGNNLFDEITDYKEIWAVGGDDKRHNLVLFHYPIAEWNNGHFGSIMLYGHLHNSLVNIRGKALNVGYDLHGKFLSIDEILNFTKSLPIITYHDDRFENDDMYSRKARIYEFLKKINS